MCERIVWMKKEAVEIIRRFFYYTIIPPSVETDGYRKTNTTISNFQRCYFKSRYNHHFYSTNYRLFAKNIWKNKLHAFTFAPVLYITYQERQREYGPMKPWQPLHSSLECKKVPTPPARSGKDKSEYSL
jgi:hypothetical protein